MGPSEADVAYKQGMFFLNKKDFTQAMRYCNRAIALAPERALFWHGKAVIFFNMAMAEGKSKKRFRDALECILKAAELSPRNVSVLLYVATVYSALKDTAKMLEWYDKAVAVDPKHNEVKKYGEIVHSLREAKKKTIEDYEDILKDLQNYKD